MTLIAHSTGPLLEAPSITGDQFRLALEAAPAGMLIVDPTGRIALANAQIEQLFGYSREELLGQPLEMLVPERLRTPHVASRTQFFSELRARPMGAGRDLYGVRKDGVEIPIEIGLNPLRTPEGMFVLSSVVNLTERKRLEKALRDQLRERDVLLQEIHHRVKNNLQVISSLINLQLGRMPRGPGFEALQECSLRVLAIAHIHEQLYLSKDFTRVPFSDYAQNLTRIVSRAAGDVAQRVQLRHELDPVAIPVDAAIPLGLILSELLTNALKHAFPGERTGSVTVRLHAQGDEIALSVADDGPGLPDGFDAGGSSSLGMQLVHTLVSQLRGRLSVHSSPAGARFEVVFQSPTQS